MANMIQFNSTNSISPIKHPGKRIWQLAVALILAMLILLMTSTAASEESSDKGTAAEKVASTDVDQLLARNLKQNNLVGIAKPRKLAELTTKVPGPIAKIFVEEGDIVPAGEPLLLIDDNAAKATLEIATVEANRDAAIERATLDWQAESERLQRLESVVHTEATSKLEIREKELLRDQKAATLKEAQESKALARAQQKLAEIELKKHTINAPFSGRVIEIHLKQGTVPKEDEIVMTLADLDELEVEMHIPLSQFGTIKAGDSLTLLAQAPVDKELTAKVQSVSPLINPTSKTFRCLLLIDNSTAELPAGFLVSLKAE